MFERLFKRTLFFALLTAAAFGVLELLVYLGREQFDINERFPEMMRVMIALSVLAWAEISIMWFRLLLSPRSDEQDLAAVAERNNNSMACAVVFAAKQFVWAVRVAAFLFLYWMQ